MSCIFKGDSIYKSGGGGGGYKDGGQLIDGDFIEVKNNTISSYDNVSRDPVNFYFEVKDGEVLNSVVELTTAVNATINVYVLKNGFYYLLGNIGGNTVNAGEDYNLNIVGDSYSLDPVTPAPTIPEYVDIKDGIYKVAQFGSQLVMLQDLRAQFKEIVWYNGTDAELINKPTAGYNTIRLNDVFLYRTNDASVNNNRDIVDEMNEYFYPWRLPKEGDYFLSNLDATEKIKFNGTLNGYCLCNNDTNLTINNPKRDNGAMSYGTYKEIGGFQCQRANNVSPLSGAGMNRTSLVRLRLVWDI